MQMTLEVSMYPLEAVHDKSAMTWFIEQFTRNDSRAGKTTATCAQLTGDYDTLMHRLQVKMKQVDPKWGQPVLVCKFIHGALALEADSYA